MTEPAAVAVMRRELGGQLAARRKAARYLQRELGVKIGYSRTAVANAETGNAAAGRQLWERADQVLGTGEFFSRGYDRIRAQLAAESRAGPGRSGPGAGESRQPGAAEPGAAGESLGACRERGWPAEEDTGGRAWLVTGTAVDVLEVARPAGVLAAGWWLYTRGVPDEIRGLPALPDPAGALAMVTAGPRCYFLTRPGLCPWTARDGAAARDAAAPAAVRWHAGGGRVPAPPSLLDGGERAVWAHLPAGGGELVSPVALLHLLALAAGATRDGGGLLGPGGIRAVPAAGVPSAGDAGPGSAVSLNPAGDGPAGPRARLTVG